MVQIIPARNVAAELAPLLQGIQALGQGLGERRQRQQLEQQQSQQAQQFQQMLAALNGAPAEAPGYADNRDLVPNQAGQFNAEGSVSQQLSKLQEQENLVLQAGLPKEQRDLLLQTIRSRRASIAPALGVETEGAKLAQKRIDKKLTDITSKAESASDQLIALEETEALINTGNTGPSVRNFLLNATDGKDGLLGGVNAFLTTLESQGFKTAQALHLPKMKQFFGGQVRVKEMEVFLETLARFGTDEQAQRFALDMMRAQAEFDRELQDVAHNLLDDDGRPIRGFEKKFAAEREKLQKKTQARAIERRKELGLVMQKKVQMVDPNGRRVLIPEDKVAEAKKAGARIAK